MWTDAPEWLLECLKARTSPHAEEIQGDSERTLTEHDHETAKQEIGRLLKRVRDAKQGTRNATLNQSAFLIGKMWGAGAVQCDDAFAQLRHAADAAGLPEREAIATIRSGLYAGRRHPWRPFALDGALVCLNREFFYSLEGKTGFVFREVPDAVTGNRGLRRIYPAAFREMLGNQMVTFVVPDGKTKSMRSGDAWMRWSGRRAYDEVIFVPGRELGPNIYNQWQGFAVEPADGDCSSFLKLMFDVLCSGDQKLFDYLLHWCARAVQKPWVAGEVAVALKGAKGIGKSFFAEHLGELFGNHFVVMTNGKHLTGNFNAHLETAVLVFADEAFWAGDKQGEGTLKGLITGKYLLVERKGIDSKQAPNYVHLIVASNSDWVVPATDGERRFFVLNVSDARRGDHAYFGDLESQWQAGGREAFLHHLMQLDLKGFNVRSVPQTQALLDQKLLTLPNVDRWIYGVLQTGQFDSKGWQDWISTSWLFDLYSEFCNDEHTRIGTREAFGMRLGRLLPPRPGGKPPRCQRQSGSLREWGYEFADLTTCRRHFESFMDAQIEWDTEGAVPSVPPLLY